MVEMKTAQEMTRDSGINSSIHSRNSSYILFKTYSFDSLI